ncbi:Lysozyme [Dactylellina cionopaga]|nr:Lysozyme [Dactylellina cionopaga]
MISKVFLYSVIAFLDVTNTVYGAPLVAARACIGPPVNQATIDLVAEFEGFVPDPYLDPTGNPTIGYGHLCSDNACSDVTFPKPLSDADGKALLAQDLTTAQNCITVQTANPVTLNANQYGALVSWAFNVGCGNVKTSTLLSKLNGGADPGPVIADELPQWRYSNGVVLPGLERRRAAEVALAQTATSDPALPINC